MKPVISKLKDPRNHRRIVGYRARISQLAADGTTPREATEACERTVFRVLANADAGILIHRAFGRVLVIAPSRYNPTTWEYWLSEFAPEYRVSGFSTANEALDHAYSHTAQIAWNHDADDDAMLRELPESRRADFRSWVRFQRAYARAKANGATDVEAHQLALEPAA